MKTKEGLMQTQTVDPSISRTPIRLNAKDQATVCVLCSHNCALRVDVVEGQIENIRADETSPISHGYICNKGFSIPSYVNHAQRVSHPLKRRPEGGFEQISWQQAIAEISAKLKRIRDQHAPRSIGLVGIGGQANHLDAPFGVTFLSLLGSRRFFNALAQEKSQHWMVLQWMLDSSSGTSLHPDHDRSDFLLVLGTNPHISNRGHNPTDGLKALARDTERKMVVVDPRVTETTRQADRHLRLKPGTDAYLLLALAAIIVGRDLGDADFIRDKTLGYAEIKEQLAEVDVQDMARRCGLDVDDIVATAEELATAQHASLLWDLGVEMTLFSTLNSYLLHLLIAVTGNMGKAGGNVFTTNLNPPTPDLRRHDEPERALASGIPAVSAFARMGVFSPVLIPEEIMFDHPERLRALIVEGANPLLSYPETKAWLAAREKLELLVVIEPAMTETARVADYVLPTPVGYEKWEMASFPRGFPGVPVQVRPPIVPALGEALPEGEIYIRLAEAMGLVPEVPAELHELAAGAAQPAGAARYLKVLQGAAKQAKFGAPLYWAYRTLGHHLDSPVLSSIWFQAVMNGRVRGEAVARAFGPEWQDKDGMSLGLEVYRRLMAHPEGVEIARLDPATNLDDRIGFDDKKIRLAPQQIQAEVSRAIHTPPAHDPDYPVIMASGLRTRWTANTIQRDPQWRKGRGPHCALNLSPGDAERMGVSNGDTIRVVTKRGSVELPATIDAKLMDGHVWMPNGFGMQYPSGEDGYDGPTESVGVNMNDYTDLAARDPFSGCPHHRYVPCRLEPVGG
jgi:anaerobic selenocysteine-containing dehydrogenase